MSQEREVDINENHENFLKLANKVKFELVELSLLYFFPTRRASQLIKEPDQRQSLILNCTCAHQIKWVS